MFWGGHGVRFSLLFCKALWVIAANFGVLFWSVSIRPRFFFGAKLAFLAYSFSLSTMCDFGNYVGTIPGAEHYALKFWVSLMPCRFKAPAGPHHDPLMRFINGRKLIVLYALFSDVVEIVKYRWIFCLIEYTSFDLEVDSLIASQMMIVD